MKQIGNPYGKSLYNHLKYNPKISQMELPGPAPRRLLIGHGQLQRQGAQVANAEAFTKPRHGF